MTLTFSSPLYFVFFFFFWCKESFEAIIIFPERASHTLCRCLRDQHSVMPYNAICIPVCSSFARIDYCDCCWRKGHNGQNSSMIQCLVSKTETINNWRFWALLFMYDWPPFNPTHQLIPIFWPFDITFFPIPALETLYLNQPAKFGLR